MWILDILKLNQRKLNHHEEVYAQGTSDEVGNVPLAGQPTGFEIIPATHSDKTRPHQGTQPH